MDIQNYLHPTIAESDTLLLLISVANHEFALPVVKLVTTAPLQSLIKTPNLPKLFAGFLRHQAQLFPIVKIDQLFQTPAMSFYSKAQAVIVETITNNGEPKVFGLLTDDVLGQFTVKANCFHKVLSHHLLGWMEYNAELYGQFFPVVSPTILLEEIENYCLANFALFDKEAKPTRSL